MITCYIFIKAAAGFVESIVSRLRQMEEVKEANAVTGTIDILVKVEVEDFTYISKVILSKIHQIDGVEKTSSHFVTDIP